MSALVIDLNAAQRALLRAVAQQVGKREEELVAEWVDDQLSKQSALSEQARGIEVLRQAGMLTELGPELQQLADESTITLEEIHAIFKRIGGKSLSEIVIEQRGPKV